MSAIVPAVEALLLMAAAVLLVPLAVLTLQVVAALWPAGPSSRKGTTPVASNRPPIAILMPAHDEASGIAPVIAAVKAHLTAQDRLLVVADNCSDDTAGIAARAGAEVVERSDPIRRGKGYALDFGVRHLATRPPEIVVIVDADCIVEGDALDRLAHQCAATGLPAQALYLMHAPAGAGTRLHIAAFAWIVKNQVRALGYWRLGLPCQLMGTGMAFPWAAIRSAPLASGHIVEDLQLGLDLAAAGTPPRFCPDARVTSLFPSAADGIESQRTRWERGHLSVIAQVGPRLFGKALAKGDGRLLAMALDLCVPPLATLVLALAALLVASALFAVTGVTTPLFVAMGMLVLLVLVVLSAWLGFGRGAVSLGEMLLAPLYAARKVPMYVRMLRSRPLQWVRTRRDDRPG
jgi:cellulose synthase/poly-beta-1,6-N-acetylglucosamine synthase-like glycosyltransferase